MKDLTKTCFELPSFRCAEWKWRTKEGEFIAPRKMETRHLFYTLRMIWNHKMPRHYNVGRNINRYRFGPMYTDSYMKEAISAIGQELNCRDDLELWMKVELKIMADRFAKEKVSQEFYIGKQQ